MKKEIFRNNILTPREWIKKVLGKEHLKYLDEEILNLNEILELMKWYGDYISKKINKH